MKFYLNRLRQFREDLDLSQVELSAQCGIAQTKISKWEASVAFPAKHNIEKLAEFFKCDPHELFPKPNLLVLEMKRNYKDEMLSKNELIKFQAEQIIDKNKEITIANNRTETYKNINTKLNKELSKKINKDEVIDEFDTSKIINLDEFN